MDADSLQARLLSESRSFVRKKARQLAKARGFTKGDREDIEQELILDLLVRADGFDPSKGNERQFAYTVVNRRVATLIEARRAAKRGADVLHVSLDEEPRNDDGDSRSRHDLLDREIYLGLKREPGEPDFETRDIEIDLSRALADLPSELKRLAVLLYQGATVAEIARDYAIPRTTVGYRLEKLRVLLREGRLADYLRFPPSDRERFR